MDHSAEAMLQQMQHAAFLVRDNKIVAVNQAASSHFIQCGSTITELIQTGAEEYATFCDGSLYLTINVCDSEYPCTVISLQDYHLFTVQLDTVQAELRILSLAAQQLSIPISEISLLIDQLKDIDADRKAQITQNLFRLKRIVGNMADASEYQNNNARLCRCQLISIFEETLEKASTMLSESGIVIRYTTPKECIYGYANSEMLRRAIYNLISNAVKFSDYGKVINIQLKHIKNKLHLTVQGGTDHSKALDRNLFHSYSRQPDLKDKKYGIGLGMSLIHAVTAVHGGTVLIQRDGNRHLTVTMTISIIDNDKNELRSPVLIPDIYGGNDQALIELSDILPYIFYDKELF